MKTWILVANSSRAKVLTTDNLRIDELEPVYEFTHPESRKKISDLISDKPGHYKTDAGAHSAYSKNDPKEIETEHFAVELVRELKTGWDQHKFKNLIIVATAHFYGLLKKHLHTINIPQDAITHVSKDYSSFTLPSLHSSLKKHLFV